MEQNNFYIEVKTPWIKNNQEYTRDIIKYGLKDTVTTLVSAINNLEVINVSKEVTKSIKNNKTEIISCNQNDNEILNKLTEYVKYQWLMEE